MYRIKPFPDRNQTHKIFVETKTEIDFKKSKKFICISFEILQ